MNFADEFCRFLGVENILANQGLPFIVPVVINFEVNDRERQAIEQMCLDLELTPEQVLRQGLRTYQYIHAERQRDIDMRRQLEVQRLELERQNEAANQQAALWEKSIAERRLEKQIQESNKQLLRFLGY